jgi:hypothetical protein
MSGPQPLSRRGIQRAIIDRALAARSRGQCNSTWIAHYDGVLRGLLWALTGADPGVELSTDMARVFAMADIPHQRIEDRVEFLEPS